MLMLCPQLYKEQGIEQLTSVSQTVTSINKIVEPSNVDHKVFNQTDKIYHDSTPSKEFNWVETTQHKTNEFDKARCFQTRRTLNVRMK